MEKHWQQEWINHNVISKEKYEKLGENDEDNYGIKTLRKKVKGLAHGIACVVIFH